MPGVPIRCSPLAQRTCFTHAPNLQQVQRQRDGEEKKDSASPRRRVLDLVSLGVEEDSGACARGHRERREELRSRRVPHLDHPRDEPAWRRGAIVRVLGIPLGEPQLLASRLELEHTGQQRSRHERER